MEDVTGGIAAGPMLRAGRVSWAWAWGPVIGWAAVIFALSSLPGGMMAADLPGVDKLAHAGVFAVLALVILRALGKVTRWRASRCVACAIICVAAYGALDELHQWFTPQRSVELLDVVADVTGGALASAAWLLNRRVQGARRLNRSGARGVEAASPPRPTNLGTNR